jgi:hypothetical protein
VRTLPYAYRGEEVMARLEGLGAGARLARLDPVGRLDGMPARSRPLTNA